MWVSIEKRLLLRVLMLPSLKFLMLALL